MPKLDKNIYGGAFGGALIKDKLFFFGNYERLEEDSEALTERQVPSLSMRDGVMVYQCADPAAVPGGVGAGFHGQPRVSRPGYYGATPSELAGLDPLGIGPSLLVSEYFKQLPGAKRRRARRLQHHGVQVLGAVQQHIQHDASGASITGPEATRASSDASTFSATP